MTKVKFPSGVIKEANSISVDKTYLGKLELTEGVTIDESASRDLDDGFQLVPDSEGWTLSVSIADAASAIMKDSCIYDFAKHAICTRYLQGYNEPMLPPELSENKLSLLENKIRPAVTFRITISSDLDITDFKIKKTAFKNRRKLSYQLADEILAREKPDKEFGHLAECYHLANLLLEKRRENGALVLYDFIQGMYTNEEGQIIINRNRKLHMANIIVQEFMILVNSVAAEFFIKKNKQLVLRNHVAKSTTPPRDEIYNQYVLAKSNPLIIDTLKKRIELWFEKAEYSTKLRGHYGLNLPAYTHLTSPLRRFPDLVNQYIISSYLSGKRTPYSKDNLSKIALNINRNIRNIRDSKNSYFKEKAVKDLVDISESPSPEALELLDSKKFSTLLQQSCIINSMSSKLFEETERRILSGNVGPEHLVCLLFKLNKKNIYYDKLFKLISEFLSIRTNFARSVLNMAVQKKYTGEIKFEVKKISEGFACIISVMQDSVQYSSPEIQIKNTGRDAINSEAVNFLKNYIENKLVPISEMKFDESMLKELEEETEDEQKNDTAVQETEKTAIVFNYTGRLLEFCTQNKIFSSPEYVYNQQGMADDLVFDCKCIVKSEDTVFEANSSGKKKITAKHLASKEMKETLEKYLSEVKIDKAENSVQDDVKENGVCQNLKDNYVGNLNNISIIHDEFSRPEFEFREEIKDGKYNYTCFCRIIVNNNLYSAEETGNSKKSAKQAAVFKLMQILEEKSILKKSLNGTYEVSNSEVKKPKITVNYAGMLNSIIQMHNNFSKVDFGYFASEIQSNQEFSYRCRLSADDREIITEYTSEKKFISKQNASFLMIKELLGLFAEKITVTEDIKEKLPRENYAGLKYFLFRWNNTVNPLFSCLTELNDEDSKIEIVTTQKSALDTLSQLEKILNPYLIYIDKKRNIISPE